MNKKEFLFASLFFIILIFIFFLKIFHGKIPLPTDIILGAYYPWLDYKWGYEIGVPVKNPILTDAVSLVYPVKWVASEMIKAGELPLWNPYIFAGTPLFASTSAALFFPTMIFFLFFSTPLAWTLQIISQPFLALIFMYLLLRDIKLPALPAIFGSITFAFSGSIMIWLEWNNQATTACILPLLIFALNKFLKSKKIKWGLLLSFSLCLQIFSGYLQIVEFSLFALLIWFLLFKKSFLDGVLLVPFFILGFTLSAVFLIPSMELLFLSQRIYETINLNEAFLPAKFLITMLAPDFYGNPATYNFWGGGNYLNVALYTGIIPLIFASIALMLKLKDKLIIYSVALVLFTLLVITSNPISIFLYKVGVWGGESITLNRAAFLVNFAIAITGAYGLSLIDKRNLTKVIKCSAAILFALSLILIICITKTHATVNAIIVFKNLIFPCLLVLSLLIISIFFLKFKIKLLYYKFIIIVIIAAELFRFGLKFNTFSPSNNIYPNTPTTDFLQKHPNERFISEREVLPPNMWVPFKLESITGYEAFYPKNMAKLIAVANSKSAEALPQTKHGVVDKLDSPIIERSGTKLYLALKKDREGRVDNNFEINKFFQTENFIKVAEDKSLVVLENTKSLPRAYLVNNVIKANDAETLKKLLDKDFPIDGIAITPDLELTGEKLLQKDVTYKNVSNSKIIINTNTDSEAFLVVLDAYYPGWEAKINSKPSKIFRTNYAFQGVIVPKGKNIVELDYKPKSLLLGFFLSLLSIIIALSALTIPKILKKFKK